MTKGFSPSCENNKHPILEQLSVYFKDRKQVFEIGSGTGQHAVFFAKHLPHLIWNTSDMLDNHNSINAWLGDEALSNVVSPIEFLFGKHDWPNLPVDAIFTANTTHIMQPEQAKLMMQQIGTNLDSGSVFCQYGPMNVDGGYTSYGNRDFDYHLQQNGYGGIRDIAELTEWAINMKLVQQIPMPANNFLLVWEVI